MTKNIDLDIKTLLKNYIVACLNREKARSEPNLANKYFDEIVGYYKCLKEAGLLNELRPLLFHKEIAVQLSAASSLLAIDETAAKKVLIKIVELELGETSFTAKMVLKEWDNGGMKSYR